MVRQCVGLQHIQSLQSTTLRLESPTESMELSLVNRTYRNTTFEKCADALFYQDGPGAVDVISPGIQSH